MNIFLNVHSAIASAKQRAESNKNTKHHEIKPYILAGKKISIGSDPKKQECNSIRIVSDEDTVINLKPGENKWTH